MDNNDLAAESNKKALLAYRTFSREIHIEGYFMKLRNCWGFLVILVGVIS
jgi:hypothetical protein